MATSDYAFAPLSYLERSRVADAQAQVDACMWERDEVTRVDHVRTDELAALAFARLEGR